MTNADPVRLDVWLWAARFFKTRPLARQAVDAGRVRIDDQPCKPARALRVGDRLLVRRGDEDFRIQVTALSSRRGPASVAAALYLEDETSRLRRESERARRQAERAGYQPPEGRPDKRARRLIRALGDIDSL